MTALAIATGTVTLRCTCGAQPFTARLGVAHAYTCCAKCGDVLRFDHGRYTITRKMPVDQSCNPPRNSGDADNARTERPPRP